LQYEFHEVANIFPMMSEAEFGGLVEDIKNNGQIEPIWVHQQKIIDGRNRYNACLEIGVEPIIKQWDCRGSLVSFVTSLNLHRRHLNASQLGMVTARIECIFKKDAGERMRAGKAIDTLAPNGARVDQATQNNKSTNEGKALMQAAKMVGSGYGTALRAKKVISKGTDELVSTVDRGELNLTKAEKIAVLPKEDQAEAIKDALSNEPIKPKPVITPPSTKPDPPKGFLPDPEGTEKLYEILGSINETLGLLVGHAETELINLPKNTVKEARYRVGGCIDAIHKSAERLEIFYKMYK